MPPFTRFGPKELLQATCLLRLRHYRKNDSRGRRGIVVNRMNRRGRGRCSGDRLAVLRIAIEAGKIAAGNLQPDAMATAEEHAGRPQIDLDSHGFRGNGSLFRVISPPEDSV